MNMLMWDKMKREVCAYCKVSCQIKNYSANDIVKMRAGNRTLFSKRFEFIEQNKYCDPRANNGVASCISAFLSVTALSVEI